MTIKNGTERTIPYSEYAKLKEIHIQLKNNHEKLKNNHDKLTDEYTKQSEELYKLKQDLEWLKRNMFGQKSERFIPDDNQLSLDFGMGLNKDPEAEKEHVEYERLKPAKKKKGHNRGEMPTHLPFKDTVIEPELEDTENYRKLDEEITWEYEYKPGSLFVHRFIRPKYVRNTDNKIIIGSLPARPIEKGNFGPGFMANVTVDKYTYHLPLYRQIQKYSSKYGVTFSESTFVDIIKNSVFWMEIIYNEAKRRLLESTYIMADETTIPVKIKLSKKKMKKCYYWVYYDPLSDIIIFEYNKSRGQEVPDNFLEGFNNGILQIDGYVGYNNVINKSDIAHASCMAHVRRKFENAITYDKDKAEYALKCIRSWFKIEAEAQEEGLSYEERLELRNRNNIKESFVDFKKWMDKNVIELRPNNPIRKACVYGIKQWKGFEPYLNDGRVELSNNLVEGAIRPITIGRKNYLFKGSERAAQRGAVVYSIVAMAKKHGLDPFKYIKMLLKFLPQEKSNNLENYMPWNIK